LPSLRSRYPSLLASAILCFANPGIKYGAMPFGGSQERNPERTDLITSPAIRRAAGTAATSANESHGRPSATPTGLPSMETMRQGSLRQASTTNQPTVPIQRIVKTAQHLIKPRYQFMRYFRPGLQANKASPQRSGLWPSYAGENNIQEALRPLRGGLLHSIFVR